jgi:hypothetical protein
MSSIKSFIFIGAVLSAFSPLLPIATAHAQKPAPEPEPTTFGIDVSIDSATVDNKTGQVIVTGTVFCSEPALIYLGVEVTQAVGRKDGVEGGNWANSVECNEDGVPFKESIFARSGRFGPGQAVIRVYADGCGATGCDVTTLQQPVRLEKR